MTTRPFLTAVSGAYIVIAITIFAITPTQAKVKHVKDWCLGNGCVTGGGAGDWHECRGDESNVCRQWSDKKPK
jgi:hypothetical protein